MQCKVDKLDQTLSFIIDYKCLVKDVPSPPPPYITIEGNGIGPNKASTPSHNPLLYLFVFFLHVVADL